MSVESYSITDSAFFRIFRQASNALNYLHARQSDLILRSWSG